MFAWVNWYKGAVLAVLAILCCRPLWAQHSISSLAQLNHRAYHVSDGAPAFINTLAETRDGTMWVGSGVGLFRFDGARFWRYPGPSDEPLPSMDVSALLATPDGGLWIGFTFGGVCRLWEGKVTRYGVRDGIPTGTIRKMA